MTAQTEYQSLQGLQSSLDGLQAQISARMALVAPPKVSLPGINLNGGDFGTVPGVMGHDYAYPTSDRFGYWAGLGFKVARLPFKMERVQPVDHGALDPTNLAEIDRCVQAAQAAKILLILDPHSYGERLGVKCEPEDIPNLLWQLATRYCNAPYVAFGVQNEPAPWGVTDWPPVLKNCLAAIRVTGAKNLVLLTGSGYDGAHDFVSSGSAAAIEALGINDPNVAIDLHQYLDADFSGTHEQQYVAGSGATVLALATTWARAAGFKLFLGEFGFAMPAGQVETTAMLQFMAASADVWMGWTVWSAGTWFSADAFCVEPVNGASSPQVAVLQGFM